MRRIELNKIGNFSDTTLEALEAENKDYRLWDSSNLYFFVKANGSKSWQFRYKKIDGSWSWKGLGAYPLLRAKEARVKARGYLNEIEVGTFLEVDKYKLSSLIDRFLIRKQKTWSNKYFAKMQLSIKKHIYPEFGNRDFRKIKSKEWYYFFERLEYDLKITSQMIKLLSFVRATYDWARIDYDFNENPIRVIQGNFKNYHGKNYKFVERSELQNLLSDIRSYSSRSTAIGLELLLLLFPRPGELLQAKWDQFDFDKKVWVKPPEIMKNKLEHRVPLSQQVLVLLHELKEVQTTSICLFPSKLDNLMPMSDGTFNKALHSLGYKNRQDPHGFRHLASTILNNEFSDKYQIIESLLSHVKQGTKGIYDKAEHFEEKANLLQWWADYIYTLV